MNAYRDLQIGDTYTFIHEAPILHEGTAEPAVIGDMIRRWFATNEPGRVFKIAAIFGTATYVTTFVGFEIIDCESGTISVQPEWRREA